VTEPVHDHHHDDAPDWDAAYSGGERIWSGNPNAALVAEVADLAPGHALDVGCGEGADAVWLAHQGWTVTAVDPSAVALDRARTAADAAGLDIAWRHAGLLDADLDHAGYDLVSVQYPALRKATDRGIERALLSAVAPGGTLLVVVHADMDAERARAHGFDPADYVDVADLVGALDPTWEVVVDEEREREVIHGRGADHHLDRVVRVRRAA
jgi:SAM-dependent methyltransferase